MSTTLALDYAPNMNAELLVATEQAGKRLGLPLMQIELLGQCPDVANEFVIACQANDGFRFVATVDWDQLEAQRAERQVAPHLIAAF